MAPHVDRMLSMVAGTLESLAPSRAASHDPAATQAGFERIWSEAPEAPELVLRQRWGLSALETQVLCMAAAPWLEPAMQDLIARANDNLLHDFMDPALCVRALGRSRAERLEILASLRPGGRLIDSELIHLEKRNHRPNPLFHEMIPAELLTSYLCGVRALSPSAAPYATLLSPTLKLAELQHTPRDAELARLFEHYYARDALHTLARKGTLADYPRGIAVIVQGSRGAGRFTLLKAIAGTLERHIIALQGRLLSHSTVSEATRVLRAALFESAWYSDLVVIRDADAMVKPGAVLASVLADGLHRRRAALVLCVTSDDEIDALLDSVIVKRLKLEPSTTAEALGQQWALNVPESGVNAEGVDFGSLAETINLSPLQMRKATALGYLMGDAADDTSVQLDGPLLLRSARSQISKTIGSLATVVEPELGLEDLILEDDTFRIIEEIISAARYRRMVLKDWGLEQRIRRGTGIVALFDGEPGTGKTHSAEVIAGELGLSLVHVKIAGIVDKYIGETEKHLTQLFEEVRSDLSVLLFDEADSLFAKRSTSAEKSNERYSNMNINVLLQLIERYEGVTLLTTNLKKAIDPAFERRITYKLHFDMPEAPERERIWRYLLPETITTAEPIEYVWLSEVELSGGEIKNAILLACYRAAHLGKLVDNDILYEAAQREAAAAGRVVRRGERDVLI